MSIESAMLGCFVVALDQLTKLAVVARLPVGGAVRLPGGVRIRRIANVRAPLVSVRLGTALLSWAALVGALGILATSPPFDHPLARTGLAVAAGGATGNFLDAVRRRAIVDFLDVGFWPVFNVADVAITVGIALTLLGVFLD